MFHRSKRYLPTTAKTNHDTHGITTDPPTPPGFTVVGGYDGLIKTNKLLVIISLLKVPKLNVAA